MVISPKLRCFDTLIWNMTDSSQPKGFAKARQKAEKILNNGKKLKDLLDRSVVKIQQNSSSVKGFVNDLQSVIRMIKAYSVGSYKDLSVRTLILAVAAIVYFVNPLDVVPDILVGLGFMDDATVLAYVIKDIKSELDKFTEWEKSQV